ncbi:MAG: hypothetical protein ACFFDN_42550 [Candidatus Hodarchaeota archaeon]
MELEEKLEELLSKGTLNPIEKREFWKLVHEAKVRYNSVPKELADKFGKIKAQNTPWKLYRLRSNIVLSVLTFLLGIVAWIWWFDMFIFSQAVPLSSSQLLFWIGFLLWMIFIFLIMLGPHELSHFIVAELFKIKFNGWGIYRLQPTLDIEYSSYLRSTFNKRALTHLIGMPINLFQFLAHLLITTFLNNNYWILWIPFTVIYSFLIIVGLVGGYGDVPRCIKELKRKKIHKSKNI